MPTQPLATLTLDRAFLDVAVALGLGLLVGLQRQHSATPLGGIRTFPIVTLLGTVSAYLAQSFGGVVLAAAFGGLVVTLAVSNLVLLRAGQAEKGATTDAGMLILFALGAYLVVGSHAVAIAIGAVVAALLEFKGELHGFTEKLGDADVKAIMQFALLSLVILPVLPDRTFGPYAVLNPQQIWLMVVLVVGLSLLGYIVNKLWGARAGTLAAGVLGGLISSTATTASSARQTRGASGKEGGGALDAAAAVVLIAGTIAFARVLTIVSITAPALGREAAGPLLLVLVTLLAASAFAYWRATTTHEGLPDPGNPSELGPALTFAAIYGVVLFATAAVRDKFGASALYGLAAVAGLTDVDAISLSTGRLVTGGQLDVGAGWRVVLIALLSNLAFKAALVGVVGSRRLLLRLLPGFGLAIATGVAVLLLWPTT